MTKIFVTVQIPGIHYWPGGQERSKNHQYLQYPHRHIFHIRVTKTVTHDNRDIEFLDFKDKVVLTITQEWSKDWDTIPPGNKTLCDFRNMSCEMIADRLLYIMNADEVEVSEDGENGAIVTKDVQSK